MGRLFNNIRTCTLNEAYHNQNDDHSHICDVCLSSGMTVTDREVSESAAADSTCHRGKAYQTDERDLHRADDSRYTLLQIYPENDLPGTVPHAFRRLDQSLIHFSERTLDLSREKRDSTEDQR